MPFLSSWLWFCQVWCCDSILVIWHCSHAGLLQGFVLWQLSSRDRTCFERLIQCWGAAQRGAEFHFIFAVPRTLLLFSTMSLFYLKTCTPVKGTLWSTAWEICTRARTHAYTSIQTQTVLFSRSKSVSVSELIITEWRYCSAIAPFWHRWTHPQCFEPRRFPMLVKIWRSGATRHGELRVDDLITCRSVATDSESCWRRSRCHVSNATWPYKLCAARLRKFKGDNYRAKSYQRVLGFF